MFPHLPNLVMVIPAFSMFRGVDRGAQRAMERQQLSPGTQHASNGDTWGGSFTGIAGRLTSYPLENPQFAIELLQIAH